MATTSSDEALIARVAGGDRLAMEILFIRHRELIYRFVLRFVANQADAEDLVSEVFLAIWRRAHQFKGPSTVTTWMLAIARHIAFKVRHSRERREPALPEAASQEPEASYNQESGESEIESSILRQAVSRLPSKDREIIDLIYYHGKSVEDVSQILGIPVILVKGRMHYARRKLAKSLTAQEGGETSGTATDLKGKLQLDGLTVKEMEILLRAEPRPERVKGPPVRKAASPGAGRGHPPAGGGEPPGRPPPVGGGGKLPGESGKGDLVEFSVFGPVTARPGDTVIIQVFLHRPEQAQEAETQARRSDREAKHRGAETLDILLKPLQTVGITLEAQDAVVDEPVQALVWRGKPARRSFMVELPTRSRHTQVLLVRIDVAGNRVGSIRFAIKIDQKGIVDTTLRPRGDFAKRYECAFLSHAHDDATEVLKIAQAYQAAGVRFFYYTVSLRTGSEWEKRLYEEIDRCDLFLLFWTHSAAESTWVRRETEYAFRCRQNSEEGLPDIVPILLTGSVPNPPEWLKHVHLDHVFRLAMLGIEKHKEQEQRRLKET